MPQNPTLQRAATLCFCLLVTVRLYSLFAPDSYNQLKSHLLPLILIHHLLAKPCMLIAAILIFAWRVANLREAWRLANNPLAGADRLPLDVWDWIGGCILCWTAILSYLACKYIVELLDLQQETAVYDKAATERVVANVMAVLRGRG